ncbi:hypothetical protein [Cognataquiflexum rubidum]|uniref:hypothetical protein n=1 Tax=Cognataquiflexum rubidum TaxID=2922273 RepID=UPI001F133C1C|nr:hypothetical protein [Cognataquiflexum rubidum]MCH6236676.1 hypothetical protein [Cognataquiflexum rubidum]
MAKLTLEIEDKKLKFFKDLVQHFSFVKITEPERGEDTDEQVRENIRTSVKELKEVLEGKTKSRPAKEFLKEL